MSATDTDNPAALIEAAVLYIDDEDQNPEVLTGWTAISDLHKRADAETLSAAIDLCGSSDTKRRRVGAAILGQLGHNIGISGGVFRNERYDALERLIRHEISHGIDPEVMGDALVAMGHLDDDRVLSIAVSQINHPSATVRLGVMTALSGHEDEVAINGLIRLTSDSDDEVRDWATFSLGQQIETDTNAIREALAARLSDDNPDVRVEAIAGLAKRGDKSVIPALKNELSIAVASPLFEAACDLADPELCEALLSARNVGQPWDSHWRDGWKEALAACGCGEPNL